MVNTTHPFVLAFDALPDWMHSGTRLVLICEGIAQHAGQAIGFSLQLAFSDPLNLELPLRRRILTPAANAALIDAQGLGCRRLGLEVVNDL